MSAISAMLSPTVILSEVRVISLVHLFVDKTANTIHNPSAGGATRG